TPADYVALWPQTLFYSPKVEIPFTIRVPGDLRGQKIVGQTYYYQFIDGVPDDSSELSDPMTVSP
ncbi:MAG: hypothetical protein ACRD3J_19395, partial [Thermoanaerobaculia bacterium]